MKKYLVIIITMVIALIFNKNTWAENTNSMVLDGSSYLYSNNVTTSGDFSFGAWIKIYTLPSTYGSAFVIGGKDNVGVSRGTSFFLRNDTNQIRFIFVDSDGLVAYADTDSALTSNDLNKWIHVIATIDISKSHNGITIYKDGIITPTTNNGTGATSINQSSAPFVIGARLTNGTANSFFNGKIDEPILTNSCLSSTQVASYYNNKSIDDKKYYWKLDGSLSEEVNGYNFSVNGTISYSDDVPFTTETTTEETTTETTTVTCACTGSLVLSKSATGLLTGNATSDTVEFMDLGYNSEGAYTLCVSDTSGNTLSSTTLPEMAGYTAMAMTQKSSTSVVIATYSGTSRTIFTIDYSSDIPSISSANISN